MWFADFSVFKAPLESKADLRSKIVAEFVVSYSIYPNFPFTKLYFLHVLTQISTVFLL